MTKSSEHYKGASARLDVRTRYRDAEMRRRKLSIRELLSSFCLYRREFYVGVAVWQDNAALILRLSPPGIPINGSPDEIPAFSLSRSRAGKITGNFAGNLFSRPQTRM